MSAAPKRNESEAAFRRLALRWFHRPTIASVLQEPRIALMRAQVAWLDALHRAGSTAITTEDNDAARAVATVLAAVSMAFAPSDDASDNLGAVRHRDKRDARLLRDLEVTARRYLATRGEPLIESRSAALMHLLDRLAAQIHRPFFAWNRSVGDSVTASEVRPGQRPGEQDLTVLLRPLSESAIAAAVQLPTRRDPSDGEIEMLAIRIADWLTNELISNPAHSELRAELPNDFTSVERCDELRAYLRKAVQSVDVGAEVDDLTMATESARSMLKAALKILGHTATKNVLDAERKQRKKAAPPPPAEMKI